MIKRTMDVTVAALGLITLTPLLVTIGMLVRLTSRGTALFLQERVGRGGKLFVMYKFRSMASTASAEKAPCITVRGDTRVTSVGRLLRRAKLDELPQLWNVLRGDMSLVGPRPEVPHYVARYTPEQRHVLNVRPGMTCLSSLEMFDEERVLAGSEDPEQYYLESIMPKKLRIARQYASNANTWTDLQVIAATVHRIIRSVWRTSCLALAANGGTYPKER